MLRRLCFTALGLAAVLVVTALNADEPRQDQGTKINKKDTDKDLKELASKEKILQERYAKFEADLQALHDRWAKGTDSEKQNAARLKLALDRSTDATLTERFAKYVRFLTTQKPSATGVTDLVTQSEAIGRDLKEVLELLKGMRNPFKDRKEERLSLEDQIKKLDQLIKAQKIINGQIETGLDKQNIKDNQADVTQATKDLSKKLGLADKKDKDKGKGGDEGNEAKNDKSEAKEGKGDGDKAQGKDAGKDGQGKEAKPGDAKNAGEKKPGDKQGQAKEGGKESKAGQESKPGDNKSGKGSESKAGDSKSGKGSESKAGEKKDSKGGQGKEGSAKDSGDKKEGEKQGSLKTKQDEKKACNDPKDGDKKEGSAKSGQGDKQGQPKSSDSKSGEKSQSKSGSESGKSSQGQSKSGKSSDSQGQPKSGADGQDQASSKKESPKSDDNNPQKQGPKQNVDQAVQKQDDLKKNIDKDEVKAIDDGKEAVKQLEQARRKLEELLRQLREEEQAQLLATLIQRCKEMLRMQEEVLKGTEAVARAINANNNKKPNNVNTQDALNLSDDEKKIVVEATKAIELLEAEGSAVAFPEVFQQVREDMRHVARRLGAVDPNKVTQAIEQDIIDTLKEMIKALEQAKKELDNKKPPPPSDGGQPPPQADPKLLNKIQELKMVRAMQLRVNARTSLYGREYQGEQADEPAIRRELRNLSERQEQIFEVTRKIVKGDN